jgi:large subunit ribosomal protein L4
MYRQKGTGNARRGDRNSNILVGGARAFGKVPRSFRQDMPKKMRRLANRNALLAKVVDGELKLIDKLSFDKPSTKDFTAVLEALKIDRNCLVALTTTCGFAAKSAANVTGVTTTRIDQINAFEILNHRYLLAEKDVLVAWLDGKLDAQASLGAEGSAAAVNGEAA